MLVSLQDGEMHVHRTLHLQGGSFGASPLRNDEEEHGQTLAKLSFLLLPHFCPGRDVGLHAPGLAKAEFRVREHLELLSL